MTGTELYTKKTQLCSNVVFKMSVQTSAQHQSTDDHLFFILQRMRIHILVRELLHCQHVWTG